MINRSIFMVFTLRVCVQWLIDFLPLVIFSLPRCCPPFDWSTGHQVQWRAKNHSRRIEEVMSKQTKRRSDWQFQAIPKIWVIGGPKYGWKMLKVYMFGTIKPPSFLGHPFNPHALPWTLRFSQVPWTAPFSLFCSSKWSCGVLHTLVLPQQDPWS